jgi:enoyl-CoA hydratase
MSSGDSSSESVSDIAIRSEGAVARIVLDRPRTLNAINEEMRRQIARSVPGMARDPNVYALTIRSAVPGVFSVGADLRELVHAQHEDPAGARSMLRGEYALNWLLECFSKPTVSLIDGLVMGTGAGISMYGTHRAAGEGYVFAMPETGIGFFPDDGLVWVFARMPGHVGLYLALTGRRIGRADAYRLGLVTHCIPSSRFDEIERGLAGADPVDPLLEERHEDPGAGDLEIRRDLIDSCFGADTVEGILARLEGQARRGGEAGAWCEALLADLRQRSPVALKVTFRHVREAAARDLRQTLTIDYRLACRFMGSHDFHEGVRAALIDKDRKPRWSPGRVEAVTEAMVERYFAFEPGGELVLPTRQEMQAARV